MKNTTKGTIAIAAGLVLLLGGGGTLAYWQDTEQATPATITSGTLDIQAVSSKVWEVKKYATGAAFATIDPATFKAVPGDEFRYTATFPVTTIGTNLAVEANLVGTGIAAPAAGDFLTALGTVDYKLYADGAAITPVSGKYTIPVGTTSIKVEAGFTWAFGSTGNQVGSGAQSITLNNLGFTLTQVAPAA